LSSSDNHRLDLFCRHRTNCDYQAILAHRGWSASLGQHVSAWNSLK
jgi:hypothetical protein